MTSNIELQSFHDNVVIIFKQEISRDKDMKEFFIEKGKLKTESEKKLLKFYTDYMESEDKRVRHKHRTRLGRNWFHLVKHSREKSEYNLIQAEHLRDVGVLNSIDRIVQVNQVLKSYYSEEFEKIDERFRSPLKVLKEMLREYEKVAEEYNKDLSQFEQKAVRGWSKEKKYKARLDKHKKIFLRYATHSNECFMEYQRVKAHCESYLDHVIPAILKQLEKDLDLLLHRSMETNKTYMESLEVQSYSVQEEYSDFYKVFEAQHAHDKKETQSLMNSIVFEYPHLGKLLLRDVNYSEIKKWQQEYEATYSNCDQKYQELEKELSKLTEQDHLPLEVKAAEFKDDAQTLHKINELRCTYYPLMAKKHQTAVVRDLLRKTCDPTATVSVFDSLAPQFKQKAMDGKKEKSDEKNISSTSIKDKA